MKTSPTIAPTRVSTTRAHARLPCEVTPSTSIALIATSAVNSSARTRCPTPSAARMIRPRLHQLSPTNWLKAMATRTPATTAFTRRKLIFSVAYRVTWTTSRAVRGAVSGAADLSGVSRTAMT